MDKDKLIVDLQAKVAELEKENKELHKIAQVMAMKESDARKSLQNYVDAVNTSQEYVDKTGNNRHKPVAWISDMTLKNLQTPLLSQVTHRISAKANTMDSFVIPLYTTPQTNAEPDCYGDGNVYRGVRSKDSEVKTYVFDEHAGKTTWVSTTQTKPLSDEEIDHILFKYDRGSADKDELVKFARAIEAKIRGEE